MARSGRSLGEVLDPRSNSLNLLRLLFAAMVIVSHSWPITGHPTEPSFGGAELGLWALFGFFAISGYLVTRSRLNGQSARDYYRARALRILPAFFVCLVVVAFGFAPLSLLFDPFASWDPWSGASFVLRNLPLYPPDHFQQGISGTLTASPLAELWNGPLWSLFWEAACYVGIGVAASILPRRLLKPVLVAVAVLLTIHCLLVAMDLFTISALADRVASLVLTFVLGALLFLHRDRVPVGYVTVIGGVVIGAGGVLAGMAVPIALLPSAYLVLVVGGTLPLTRVGSRYDISYGIYIYGWPVQQTIALAFGPDVPLIVFIPMSLVATVPLAWLSCVLIERPALARKGRPVSVDRQDVAVAAPAGSVFHHRETALSLGFRSDSRSRIAVTGTRAFIIQESASGRLLNNESPPRLV